MVWLWIMDVVFWVYKSGFSDDDAGRNRTLCPPLQPPAPAPAPPAPPPAAAAAATPPPPAAPALAFAFSSPN